MAKVKTWDAGENSRLGLGLGWLLTGKWSIYYSPALLLGARLLGCVAMFLTALSRLNSWPCVCVFSFGWARNIFIFEGQLYAISMSSCDR
jgi:hypothetical protein